MLYFGGLGARTFSIPMLIWLSREVMRLNSRQVHARVPVSWIFLSVRALPSAAGPFTSRIGYIKADWDVLRRRLEATWERRARAAGDQQNILVTKDRGLGGANVA